MPHFIAVAIQRINDAFCSVSFKIAMTVGTVVWTSSFGVDGFELDKRLACKR